MSTKIATLTEAVKPLDLANGEAVAAKLASAGFKGQQDCFRLCPVANFLTNACGFKVGVTSEVGHRPAEAWLVGSDDKGVVLPRAVSEFVNQFDKGLFPGLDITVKA